MLNYAEQKMYTYKCVYTHTDHVMIPRRVESVH